MRILAVTSWGGACGIAQYAEMALDAIHAADPSLEIEPIDARALDPEWLLTGVAYRTERVLWLNYHRGLHSRWTPEVIKFWKGQAKVVITMHDTYGEAPPDPLAQALHDVADAFVVHEPCVGLEQQVLIRQGVPAWAGAMIYEDGPRGWANGRPILGTVGFNFPWKNFDKLAEMTAEAGWAYLVLSNNATDADEARWKASNPYTLVIRGFQPTSTLVSYLAGCDVTAFAYECANSGTSGAIRLGLAARKPVLAFNACRQFRDLFLDVVAKYYIHWCDMSSLLGYLTAVRVARVDPGIVYLAYRDSWVNQGQKYAQVFQGLRA
jgi:hypothetical protein